MAFNHLNLSLRRCDPQKLRSQKGIAIDYHILKSTDHFYSETLEEMIGLVDHYIELRITNVLKKRTA